MAAMEWLNDTYVVQAGDVAVGFTGRGWNWGKHKWETLSQVSLSRSVATSYHIRAFQVFVLNVTTFTLKQSVVAALYVVVDPVSTDFMVRLPGLELQGASKVISYVGDYPMPAGCLWRINRGGLVAGDVVNSFVGYDHGK